MTSRRFLIGLCLTFTAISYAQAQQSAAADSPVAKYRATMNQYCVTCHNETLKTANLMLDKADINNLKAAPQLWEKVLLKLQTRSMPPVGMPRPDETFYTGLAGHLANELDAMNLASPNPGRTVSAHRLNRTEYTNAVRDLLAVDVDGASMLPPDNSGDFDNMGDLLSVSQVLMEKYMAAARQVGRLAIGDPTIGTDISEYPVSAFLLQNDRMNEDLPFGTRGGLAVKHTFPLDGEYEIKVRLLRTDGTGLVVGVDKPHQLDIRVDGKRVQLITVGGKNVALAMGAGRADKTPPSFEQAQYERTADDVLKVRFPATAGAKSIQVAFLEENYAWEGQIPPRSYENYSKSRMDNDYQRAWVDPAVANVTVTGPFNAKSASKTASRDRIFICNPSSKRNEKACAEKIISNLARAAFRKPAETTEVEPLMSLYEQGQKDGGSFDAGIEMALEGLLVSTEFLFRIEREPAKLGKNEVYQLSDIELASRLSFFLWSSIPDEELLKVAEQGKLRKPEVLDKQIKRMLADPRSTTLVNNFAEQWLLLRNLKQTEKNQELFPQFDESLRKDFQKETELFLGSIFQDDRSILDLFRADYKFLNERLAHHYGIPGIYGNRFRKVSVTDENKQGLLAQGAILAITSYPNRTSPVLRGKWVLQNIMAAPPPPPPTVIPALKESDDNGKVLSMRQAIEKHRANPVCQVCHNRMDPIGFGLENFNPIGQWRDEDAGSPVDSSGVLPDGSKFQGPSQLQKALLSKSTVIVSAFTQKLLTYAMGRDLAYYDMTAVRKIVHDSADSDYKFSIIVSGIVNSLPFQMRRTGS